MSDEKEMGPWPVLHVCRTSQSTRHGTLTGDGCESFTVSTEPDIPGWETDGRQFGYGISDEWATRIVLAVNSHERLTRERDELRAKLEAINRRASSQPLRNWDQAIADLDACADLARSALTPKATP